MDKKNTSNSERIRRLLLQNPNLDFEKVAEELNINKKHVQINVARDLKNGKCVKTSEGYDYSLYFAEEHEKEEFIEWKNTIRRELVEQLIEANKRETDSNQIRLNSKEINRLLQEITN